LSADEIFARFERTGNVAVVTMDRPPVNAVSFGFMRSILENIEAAAASDASVVILTSALPGVFCAGADLREHLDEVEHA
jgi:enoyl-CoA hydratase/carnithine racemase